MDDALLSYPPAFRSEVLRKLKWISEFGDLPANFQQAEIVDDVGDYTIGTVRPYQIVFGTSEGDFYAVVGQSGIGDCVVDVFPVP